MCIDPDNINSPNELSKWLEFNNINLIGGDLNDIIDFVWDFVNSMWKKNGQDLKDYTDHGFNHSIAILIFFKKLDKIYTWSKFERMIFAISALIHDIGMQYNHFSSLRKDLFPKCQDNLNQDEVREKHVKIGFELFKDEIKSQWDIKYPRKKQIKSDVYYHALYIAFSHSGNEILQELIDNKSSTWCVKEKHYRYYKYRPRLLAGVLKLCDELDADYMRILDPDRIWDWKLNDSSRIHWFACLFVHSIDLKINNGVIRININWRTPLNATKYQKELIKSLLNKMRIKKLIAEIDVINNFYEKCDEIEHIKTIKVFPIDQINPIEFPFYDLKKMEDFLEYANENILKIKIIDSPLFPINGHNRVIKKKIKESNNNFLNVEKETNKISLKKALKEWFNKHKKTGHFELINGEHTDTYIYCRTLVSQNNLLRLICDEIWKIHKNHNINSILAVGTSAIPIANLLSYRLNCSTTFTMSEVRQDEYYPSEVLPILENGDNVLIIDDMISGGKVASFIVTLLFTNLNLNVGKIYHHTIFRLGDRDYINNKRIDEYDFVLHIKDIVYASSSKDCLLCKQNIPIKYEKDMV